MVTETCVTVCADAGVGSTLLRVQRCLSPTLSVPLSDPRRRGSSRSRRFGVSQPGSDSSESPTAPARSRGGRAGREVW